MEAGIPEPVSSTPKPGASSKLQRFSIRHGLFPHAGEIIPPCRHEANRRRIIR